MATDTGIDSKKKLALAIIDFLNTSTTDGTLSVDEEESIEIATQCIAEAFKVDPTDKLAMSDALGGQSLVGIYGVFEKMKGKSMPKPATSPSPGPKQPSDSEKAEAEALKSKGNAAIAQSDYQTAIDFYTQAINISPGNPIYRSNRAAAYLEIGDNDSAIRDAEIAVDADPSYSKAWSRLGHARYNKGDNRGAMEAYKAGIDADGNGGNPKLKLGYETAKAKVDEEEAVASGKPDDFNFLDFAKNLNTSDMMDFAKKNIDPAMLQRLMSNPEELNRMIGMVTQGGGGDTMKALFDSFGGGSRPGGSA